ncbi:MAG: CHAT domain-containing tetratricopeptide repeat protein [Balneolaceae bacterium]|nr:CHAT domain-containing tetratricopeptide repeat protein [Balneolaceae bacterium]
MAAFVCFAVSGNAQNVQLADTLFAKGSSFKDNGNFKEAEFYYKEALNIYDQLQDTSAWLKTGLYYAEVLYYRSKYDEASALFNRLLSISHPVNDNRFKARIHSDLGLVNGRRDKTKLAVSHYKKGLEFAKEAGDSLMIGVIYNNLGHNTSDEEAMDYYKKALPYFEALGNQRSLAITLANIGRIYEDFMLLDKALEYLSKSLEIREELGNVNLLGSIYRTLGNLQKNRGNYRQALIAFQKSLEYRKKAGSPQGTATTLNDLGVLYSLIGDSDKALSYYRESLNLKMDFASSKDLASSYKNIGTRLWDLGKKEEAETYFLKALEKKQKTEDKSLLISSLFDVANVAMDKKEYTQAKKYIKEALFIADSTLSYPDLAFGNSLLGSIYSSMGQEMISHNYYKKAYSYSEFLPQSHRITHLVNLAESYHSTGSDSALIYGKEAYQIIEKQRVKVGAVSELRSSYFNRYSDFYIDLSSWILDYKDDKSQAYKLIEEAKARTLAEELKHASQLSNEALPEEVRIEKNKMLNNIDRLYTELEKAKKVEEKSKIESSIRSAELKYEAFTNSLQDKYTGYKNFVASPPISLKKAQAINEEGTAILEFAVTPEKVLAFLIHQDEVSVHQTLLKEPTDSLQSASILTEYVQNFKDAIIARAARSELDFHSDKLYQLLIKPFEKDLEQFSNLIIIPDGPLAYLPFEALKMNNSYLVELFDIKYEPSVTSYTLLKNPEVSQQKQLLAVAGSGVSDNSLQLRARSNAFSALPSTIIEVDSVSSHFSESEIIKQENITEKALKQALNTSYRFVHLATHGVIDEEDPKQSGLVLSMPEELSASSTEDGLLKSSEIYRLNLNSDMVVLSACNSGLGKYVKGEGMLGLQRSFFYAGTSSVVVSLWSVYDRSTAYLMNEFYKEIISAKPKEDSWYTSFMKWAGWDQTIPFGEKAKAMKRAKMKLINHPLFNHPVYWAPFIVVGR